jgi:hypothetical protein
MYGKLLVYSPGGSCDEVEQSMKLDAARNREPSCACSRQDKKDSSAAVVAVGFWRPCGRDIFFVGDGEKWLGTEFMALTGVHTDKSWSCTRLTNRRVVPVKLDPELRLPTRMPESHFKGTVVVIVDSGRMERAKDKLARLVVSITHHECSHVVVFCWRSGYANHPAVKNGGCVRVVTIPF